MLFSLGARLAACADMVREGKVPADIGTDHAYLPIWLVQSGKVPRAYASDIHEEPIQSAKFNIKRYGLSDKIITFTADGLAKIPPDDVDDIIIAGMGGDAIAAILAQADWIRDEKYRLILQPMSHAERLREYLYRHGFTMIDEKPVCEANRIYTVIHATYSTNAKPFTEFDFYAGRLGPDNPLSVRLLEKQADILEAVADGMAAQQLPEQEAHWRSMSAQLREYAHGEEKKDNDNSESHL
ncbi:MAG: SAM-dependent methyltransferase [Clostridia bacterium]|nr:SAM-dependent methyltransferase [Clostridia bacterium]